METKAPDFIPDKDFAPDQHGAHVSGLSPHADFIPDSQFEADEDKYGSASQQAIAGLEGAARGVSLGTSDAALVGMGVNPKDIRARQEENPATSTLSNMAGGAGLLAVTGGLAAPAEAALTAAKVAPLAARALAYGAEGAAFGAGNVISDAALGDTKINAQKILADVGMGAAFGSGLGVLSKGIEAAPSLFRKSAEGVESAAENPDLPVSMGEKPVVDSPSTGISPTSLEDIQARVKDASYRGETVEMPSKKVLEDAASRVEMLNPIHPLQFESLDNQGARDLYKTAIEMPGKEGAALRDYEALQKRELVNQTDRSIKSLSPESEPVADAVQGGGKAIKAFSDNYQEEKELLKPAFAEIKKTDLANVDHLPGVLDKMTDAVPGVARMFDTEAESIGKIKPYKTSWGIDKATYTAVKDAVESLKEGPKSFEELSNIRKGLDQNIDVLAKGQAPQEIMALKKSMMDYMQEMVEKHGAGSDVSDVREIFKRYAINEQERSVIEKAFGASVGSPEFGSISKVKPEEILDRVFKNTATVKAAKNILSPEKFNELLANHLAEQRALATDKGVFSSNKFGSYLRKNQDALNEAFRDNQGALTRLKDLNDIMRILPDSKSINPSGTAKTLWGILKAHSIPELISNAKEFGHEKLHEKILAEKLNQALAGKADQATKLAAVENIIKKTGDKINSSARGIFTGGAQRGAVLSGLTDVSNKEYEKRVKRLQELSGNPQAMIDHMSSSTDALYSTAPNITQDINNSMVTSLSFLISKIPGPTTQMPLSGEYHVSDAEKEKFNMFYGVVDNPISILGSVKEGSLTGEMLDAVQATHPDLLQEMRAKVVENFNMEKAKDLDYSVKMSLAKFLGQPLDETMLPENIQGYQMSLSMPNLSNETVKPSATGMKELKMSENVSTRTQMKDES